MESGGVTYETSEEEVIADGSCGIDEAVYDADAWRSMFPALDQFDGRCFFNNAATSQIPTSVLLSVEQFYKRGALTPSRGGGTGPVRVGKFVQAVREKVCDFIGVSDPGGVVFTSGSTESAGLVCQAWALNNLKDGDEVLYSSHDHVSSVMPWFNIKALLEEKGINIELKEFALFPHSGDPKMDDIVEKISPRTRVLCLSHIHHIYGLDAELDKLVGKLPERVRVVLDISQSVGHTPLDLKSFPVDFAFFSGHKMFAMMGIGVLWVHPRCWSEISPITYGSASFDQGKSTPITAHSKLEFGTPNMSGIVSLDAAMDFLMQVDVKRVEKHVAELTLLLIEGLKRNPAIEFLPGPAQLSCPLAFGIVSFRMLGLSSGDLSMLLDESGVSVRAGTHCSKSESSNLDSVRVSLHLYNTPAEVTRFVDVINEIYIEVVDEAL